MRPRNVLSRTVLTLASLGLMGCSATWSIGVKHDTSTGGTTVEGKIEGEIEMESQQSSIYGSGFDAHNFAIDTSGTTISVPSSGWVTIKIVGLNQQVRLSKRFQWVRSGEFIVYSDPDSVNSWININRLSGESVDYETDPIGDGGATGQQTVQTTSYYDGYQTASSSITFPGSGGPGKPCVIDHCQVQ